MNFKGRVLASGGDESDINAENSDVEEATGILSNPELCPVVAC